MADEEALQDKRIIDDLENQVAELTNKLEEIESETMDRLSLKNVPIREFVLSSPETTPGHEILFLGEDFFSSGPNMPAMELCLILDHLTMAYLAGRNDILKHV